jgi:hypothetical protein
MFIYIFKTSKEYEDNKIRILLFFLNQTNGGWKIVERIEAVDNLFAKFSYIKTDETLKYIKENFKNTHRGNKMDPHVAYVKARWWTTKVKPR